MVLVLGNGAKNVATGKSVGGKEAAKTAVADKCAMSANLRGPEIPACAPPKYAYCCESM